jgi:hypothetical protein
MHRVGQAEDRLNDTVGNQLRPRVRHAEMLQQRYTAPYSLPAIYRHWGINE